MDSQSWKIIDFPKMWPLTCHNWVKYWPRTKNNTSNREYSARAICWSFPLSSTTLRLETPREGGRTNKPPVRPKVVKHRIRARINRKWSTVEDERSKKTSQLSPKTFYSDPAPPPYKVLAPPLLDRFCWNFGSRRGNQFWTILNT